jgi:hypothetical protein
MRAIPLLLAVLLPVLVSCSATSDGPGDSEPARATTTVGPGDSEPPRATTTVATIPPQSPPQSPPQQPPPPAGRLWVPRPGAAWQWQLTTPVDTSVDVPVYDIDGHENPATVIAELHARGRKVICYVNTGAAETFRPDFASFPPAVLGKPNGWKGERWLDIRRLDVLRPVMTARFDECRTKGFDAVEADLVDAYANDNDSGFPLTADDQLAYNRMLAGLAHERGMSIGLKNDLDQVSDLVGSFEFAVNEQCAEHDECEQLLPFIQAGKAVFHVEYHLDNAQFCARTTAMRFSSMHKNLELDTQRWPC